MPEACFQHGAARRRATRALIPGGARPCRGAKRPMRSTASGASRASSLPDPVRPWRPAACPRLFFFLAHSGRESPIRTVHEKAKTRRAMKEISSTIIGIEEGDNVLFSDFEDDGEMWAGTGPRER